VHFYFYNKLFVAPSVSKFSTNLLNVFDAIYMSNKDLRYIKNLLKITNVPKPITRHQARLCHVCIVIFAISYWKNCSPDVPKRKSNNGKISQKKKNHAKHHHKLISSLTPFTCKLTHTHNFKQQNYKHLCKNNFLLRLIVVPFFYYVL
jgi:hypothetical protein